MPHSIKSAVMGPRVQPQSPWILYFDGVTRDIPSNHGGIGAVLKDSQGHTVVELKKFVGLGVSSCVAKYKALIAGLKKARSLGVEYLLVKGDSRLVHNQLVGHCSVQDEGLLEYHKRVKSLAREFRVIFMERISREDNLRADRLANEAIDEELQAVSSLSEYIDKEWMPMSSQKHTTTTTTTPSSAVHNTNLKIKPVTSISPHVVKEHAQLDATTTKPNSFSKNPSPRRLKSCNISDEIRNNNSSDLDCIGDCQRNPNIIEATTKTSHLHVQTAAQQSRIRNGSYESVHSSSPTRRTTPSSRTTPIAPLYHKRRVQLDHSPKMTMNMMETLSTFSDESTGSSQLVDREVDGPCSQEDNVANLSDGSLSDSEEFSKANYEKLLRTILKGYFHRKKLSRS